MLIKCHRKESGAFSHIWIVWGKREPECQGRGATVSQRIDRWQNMYLRQLSTKFVSRVWWRFETGVFLWGNACRFAVELERALWLNHNNASSVFRSSNYSSYSFNNQGQISFKSLAYREDPWTWCTKNSFSGPLTIEGHFATCEHRVGILHMWVIPFSREGLKPGFYMDTIISSVSLGRLLKQRLLAYISLFSFFTTISL